MCITSFCSIPHAGKIQANGIREFYVEQPAVQADFIYILSLHTPAIRIIAVTGENKDAENIREQLCPPCSAVQCVGNISPADNGAGLSDAVAYMVDKADFCICNLSVADDVKNLQEKLLQTHSTLLLNLELCLRT